jgi:hypothetical protein
MLFTNEIQAAVIVNTNCSLQGTYWSVQLFYQGLNYPFPNVTGLMTLEVNPDNRSNPYIAGNIVLTSLHLPPEPTLRKFQSLGAIAVVMQGYFPTPGYIEFAGDNGNTSDIVIPVLEIPSKYYLNQFVPYLQRNTFLSVILTSGEPNQWAELFDSDWTIAFQIILGAFTMACLIVAVVKWAQFYVSDGGFKLNIAQTCFAFVTLGLLLQAVADVDPLGMRRLFNRVATLFFSSMVTPFIATPYFLVSLYWHDSLEAKSLRLNPFPGKLIIALLVAAIGFFVLDLLFVLLRILNVDLGQSPNPVEVAATVIISGLLVALALFYIVTGISILKKIAKSSKLSSHSKKRTKAATTVLITGSVLLLLISAQNASFYWTIQTPLGATLSVGLHSILQSTAALCLVLFFASPDQRSTSANESRSNSNDKRATNSHSLSGRSPPVQAKNVTNDG